jgi:hypothetical protein
MHVARAVGIALIVATCACGCGGEEPQTVAWQVIEESSSSDVVLVGWTASCGREADDDDVSARASESDVTIEVRGERSRTGGGCSGSLSIGCAEVRLAGPLGQRRLVGRQVETQKDDVTKECQTARSEDRVRQVDASAASSPEGR